MKRDLMRCIDALDHAENLCGGLDALVCLMASCSSGDEPNMRNMSELLGSIQKDLAESLKDASRGLRQNLQ